MAGSYSLRFIRRGSIPGSEHGRLMNILHVDIGTGTFRRDPWRIVSYDLKISKRSSDKTFIFDAPSIA